MNYVCYALDDNYSMQTSTSIYSLFQSNREIEMTVFLLTIGISEENCQKFYTLQDEKHRIVICRADDYLERFDKAVSSWNLGTYLRMIMDDIVPTYVEKILYIDGDTIILSSIAELFNYNLEGNVIAGVFDKFLLKSAKERIGLKADDIYVNAGVLLIDLNRWRRENVGNKCIEYLNRNPKARSLPDQNAINIVLKGKVALLPQQYNVDGITAFLPFNYARNLFEKPYRKFCGRDDYENARMRPSIIHFIGYYLGKPWERPNSQLYAKSFRRYQEMTPWDFTEVPKSYPQDFSARFKRVIAYRLHKCIKKRRYLLFTCIYLCSERILYAGSKIKGLMR